MINYYLKKNTIGSKNRIDKKKNLLPENLCYQWSIELADKCAKFEQHVFSGSVTELTSPLYAFQ